MTTHPRSRILFASLAVAVALGALAILRSTRDEGQVPDRTFRPLVPRPAFLPDSGPRLCLDEAHFNFHTLDHRFLAFGELARRDGYRVAAQRETFAALSLGACDLLVISNAQPNGDSWDDYPSPTPSAFTPTEIAAAKGWVEGGGRLLLIADHMPLAGAATALAAAFGAAFTNGFAYKGFGDAATEAERGATTSTPTLFTPSDGTLPSHPITRGRDSSERVTQVRSFTGQAFRFDADGVSPVLVLPLDFISLEPRIAWQFEPATPRRPVGGWLQGATRRVGGGRVAFFGEAAMFSAQLSGREHRPMGMNAPLAEQNAQFVLNVLHWLSGIIDP